MSRLDNLLYDEKLGVIALNETFKNLLSVR